MVYVAIGVFMTVFAIANSALAWARFTREMYVVGAFDIVLVLIAIHMVTYCYRRTTNKKLFRRLVVLTPLFLAMSISLLTMNEGRAVVLTIALALAVAYLLKEILNTLHATNWLQLILWPTLGIILNPWDLWWLRGLYAVALIMGVTYYQWERLARQQSMHQWIIFSPNDLQEGE